MSTVLTKYRTYSNLYIWWALTLGLYGAMMLGPLRTLTDLAALPPFDLRPMGYSLEEAHTLLAALGQRGRYIYIYQQLSLDVLYPSALAVASVLSLRRVGARAKVRHQPRLALVCKGAALVAIAAACLDYTENIFIAAILVQSDAISSTLVTTASTATVAKSLMTTLSLGTLSVLAVFGLTQVAFKGFKRISWQQL